MSLWPGSGVASLPLPLLQLLPLNLLKVIFFIRYQDLCEVIPCDWIRLAYDNMGLLKNFVSLWQLLQLLCKFDNK